LKLGVDFKTDDGFKFHVHNVIANDYNKAKMSAAIPETTN